MQKYDYLYWQNIQRPGCQREFLTLNCWLYNVKFPENYFFFLRCDAVLLDLHFPTFRSVIVFTLSRSSSLRTVVSGCWNSALVRIRHFSKNVELHKQKLFVTPQNNSAFRNTAVRTSVFNPYFLTESSASLLLFVMYSHNPSTSTNQSLFNIQIFSLHESLNHSFTHSLPLSFSPCLPLHTSFSHPHWFSCPLTSTISLSVTHSLFHSHISSTC